MNLEAAFPLILAKETLSNLKSTKLFDVRNTFSTSLLTKILIFGMWIFLLTLVS